MDKAFVENSVVVNFEIIVGYLKRKWKFQLSEFRAESQKPERHYDVTDFKLFFRIWAVLAE